MKNLKKRVLSVLCAVAMAVTALPLSALNVSASGDKYISEVFIAYGRTESEAINWLTSHGWEPVGKDLNAGKLSFYDDNAILNVVSSDRVAAVMGIKRTNDPNDAVTDMAVMNMCGGYSIASYEELVNEKRTEINAFVDSFLPALQEFRENYAGRGSSSGKARADLAYDLLNRLHDGEIDGEYAVNDTGKPLGDLLLKETSRELGDSYDAMPRNEQLEHADITQILLESNGAAVIAVEQALAIATDTNEQTWLERLSEYSGTDLEDMAEDFLPSVNGKHLTASAVLSQVKSTYGDDADILASGYEAVQQDLIWIDAFFENNHLLQNDGESDDEYEARFEAYFDGLKEEDEDYYFDTVSRFNTALSLQDLLKSIEYEGEWGETLADFFLPEDGKNYGEEPDYFLPMAMVLSDGQRAGLTFLTLKALLQVGAGTEELAKEAMPDFDELVEGIESPSIYAGINRAIFRGGVALTSKAEMEKNLGKDPFEVKSEIESAELIFFASGSLLLMGGLLRFANRVQYYSEGLIDLCTGRIGEFQKQLDDKIDEIIKLKETNYDAAELKALQDEQAEILTNLKNEKYDLAKFRGQKGPLATAGRTLMAIGGLILLAYAVYEIVQVARNYHRDFSQIPLMIVDEADIVSYMTDEHGKAILDENGKQKRDINFNQFLYYEVVKCNRQEVGEIADWQDGVDNYVKWGCGDAADLNCDCGKQWLALYTNKSSAKGKPILADSLVYQTGSDKAPDRNMKSLHYFCYDFAMNIADEAYCYNDKNGGIYLFWKEDEKAYNTASSFSTGHLALAGVGGLAVGILGTSFLMTLGKKKKETPDAPAAA